MTEQTLCQGAVECQGDLCDVSVHRMIGRAERGAYVHHPGKSQMVAQSIWGDFAGDSWDNSLVEASPGPHQLQRMA